MARVRLLLAWLLLLAVPLQAFSALSMRMSVIGADVRSSAGVEIAMRHESAGMDARSSRNIAARTAIRTANAKVWHGMPSMMEV